MPEDRKRIVTESVAFLKKRIDFKPLIGVVAGSGLGSFAIKVHPDVKIPYGEIPHFPVSNVSGHSGILVVGSVNGIRLIVLSGRKHFYEGVDPWQATLPIRVLALLGVKFLVLSNAAGGLNRQFTPGDLMLISDHINFLFRNPLVGDHIVEWGPRFVDMSEPYDRELRKMTQKVACQEGIPLQEGVYVANLGPTYETFSEVEMERFFGADAVGMSTVPECLVARQMGMRVLGISCISNSLVLEPGKKTTHEEVLEVTKRVEERFERLLIALLLEMNRKGLLKV
jgi:purine-nucleoside phosphorylase